VRFVFILRATFFVSYGGFVRFWSILFIALCQQDFALYLRRLLLTLGSDLCVFMLPSSVPCTALFTSRGVHLGRGTLS